MSSKKYLPLASQRKSLSTFWCRVRLSESQWHVPTQNFSEYPSPLTFSPQSIVNCPWVYCLKPCIPQNSEYDCISFYHVEYAFGGHPYNWSGIFEMSPKSVETLGDDFKFRFVDENDIRSFVRSFTRSFIHSFVPSFSSDNRITVQSLFSL